VLHDDFSEKIDRFTRGIIRRKISQLIGRAGFTEQDRKDLEQEIIQRLLQSLPSFDPNQAHRNVFVTTVVERYVANILRNKQADKRDHRRISSLHTAADIGEDEPVELAETISQRELDARLGCESRSDQHLADLAQDVAEVMAKLPEELRTLAERLKTGTVSDVARDMGIPRTTLYESIRQLRKRFEDADLKDYL
jgi:RNA polymerase sigma-70 factor, ECF subfamily